MAETKQTEALAFPELLKAAEVAKVLRVSTTTVYRWMDTGVLPYRRIGGSRRVIRDDLAKVITPPES